MVFQAWQVRRRLWRNLISDKASRLISVYGRREGIYLMHEAARTAPAAERKLHLAVAREIDRRHPDWQADTATRYLEPEKRRRRESRS